MVASVFSSAWAWLTDFFGRVCAGHFMSWEEACQVENSFIIYGFKFEISALEALLIMLVYIAAVMMLAYFCGYAVGYWKGHNECDIEWWESIEKHYERLKKYGFGDNEANDRAAVKTYKEMHDKRTRKD